jgi:hypothetical protein
MHFDLQKKTVFAARCVRAKCSPENGHAIATYLLGKGMISAAVPSAAFAATTGQRLLYE